MTETLGSATLIISTDDRKLRRGIKDAKGRAKKLGQSMGRVGKRLTTAISLPILGLGAAILKSAANFETGMNQVRALTGATGEDFTKLEEQAKELGATTQFSAGQAADAMGFMAQAGLSVEEIYSSLPATVDLAAASQQDLATTADQVTNIMKGFGIATEDTTSVTDMLTAAFTGSNTNLTQLAEAMKLAGPVAAGFGISFAETAAVLGSMANAGFQASLGGTAFRGALVRLATPTKENAELLRQLGVNVLKADGTMIPFADTIDQLKDAGATAAEIMKIFGQRAGPALIPLVAAGGDAIRNFTEDIDDSAGKTKEIAEVQMEGLTGAIRALKSALEAVSIALGQSGLLEWVTDAAKATADWFRELAKTNPKLLKWGVIVAVAGAVIGPLIVGLVAFIAMLLAISAPIAIVIAAIIATGGLIWAIWELSKNWDTALGKILDFSESWAGSLFLKVFAPIIGWITDIIRLWNWMVSLFTDAPDFQIGVPGGVFGPDETTTSTEEIVNAPGGVPAAIITQQSQRPPIVINVGDDDLLDGSGLRRLVERINEETADDATNLQVQTI